LIFYVEANVKKLFHIERSASIFFILQTIVRLIAYDQKVKFFGYYQSTTSDSQLLTPMTFSLQQTEPP